LIAGTVEGAENEETIRNLRAKVMKLFQVKEDEMHAPEQSSPAKICDTYSEAVQAVNQAKKDFGNGISSRVIIYNASPEPMDYYDDENYSGKFYTGPPKTIPPFKHAAFLHTKRVAAIAGSRAAVMFTQQKSQSVVAFGWNNPYMGANYIGVKVEQSANAPIVRSNLYEVMYNHKGTVGKDVSQRFHVAASGQILIDSTTTLIYFELKHMKN